MRSWLIGICVAMLAGTVMACDKAPGCCTSTTVVVPVVVVQPGVCCVRDLRAERLARRAARKAARCCVVAEPVCCAPAEPVKVEVCCEPVKVEPCCLAVRRTPVRNLLQALLPPWRMAGVCCL